VSRPCHFSYISDQNRAKFTKKYSLDPPLSCLSGDVHHDWSRARAQEYLGED